MDYAGSHLTQGRHDRRLVRELRDGADGGEAGARPSAPAGDGDRDGPDTGLQVLIADGVPKLGDAFQLPPERLPIRLRSRRVPMHGTAFDHPAPVDFRLESGDGLGRGRRVEGHLASYGGKVVEGVNGARRVDADAPALMKNRQEAVAVQRLGKRRHRGMQLLAERRAIQRRASKLDEPEAKEIALAELVLVNEAVAMQFPQEAVGRAGGLVQGARQLVYSGAFGASSAQELQQLDGPR